MSVTLITVLIAIGATGVTMWLAFRARGGSDDEKPPASIERVKALAAEGRTIDAIKEYRRLTGASLAEAKAYVTSLNRP